MAVLTQAKVFRLKHGHCQVYPDRIAMVQHRYIQREPDNHLFRLLFLNILLAFVFILVGTVTFAYALMTYSANHQINASTVLFGLVSGICVILSFMVMLDIASKFINSAAGEISREQITHVKFSLGVPILLNPYFSIKYMSESGKSKKRWLILPNSSSGNDTELAKALTIFREEKLI